MIITLSYFILNEEFDTMSILALVVNGPTITLDLSMFIVRFIDNQNKTLHIYAKIKVLLTHEGFNKAKIRIRLYSSLRGAIGRSFKFDKQQIEILYCREITESATSLLARYSDNNDVYNPNLDEIDRENNSQLGLNELVNLSVIESEQALEVDVVAQEFENENKDKDQDNNKSNDDNINSNNNNNNNRVEESQSDGNVVGRIKPHTFHKSQISATQDSSTFPSDKTTRIHGTVSNSVFSMTPSVSNRPSNASVELEIVKIFFLARVPKSL